MWALNLNEFDGPGLLVCCVILTGQLTGQDLSSETKAAVPTLGKDTDVTRHDRSQKLVYHRCVPVHIGIKQLETDRDKSEVVS